MLKTKKAATKFPGRTKEDRPLDMLLAVLCIFSNQGKDEVSISEFQESVAEFQKKSGSLGYTFSERFLLSTELLSDLRDLDYKGYIRDYHYRLDSLLPKRFLALTSLGRGRGKEVLRTVPDDTIGELQNAVKFAINNYHTRWRLWARETS